jgi:hypothetical protein
MLQLIYAVRNPRDSNLLVIVVRQISPAIASSFVAFTIIIALWMKVKENTHAPRHTGFGQPKPHAEACIYPVVANEVTLVKLLCIVGIVLQVF